MSLKIFLLRQDTAQQRRDMIETYATHATLLHMIRAELSEAAMKAVAAALENAYQLGKLDALKDEIARKTANKEW